MKYKDYYQAMGVDRGATADEIKKAYRKLAHKYHPDVSKDVQGEEKFKELAEAYATLKDPEKRQAYDNLGRRPAGEQFTPPPDWQQQFHTDAAGFDDVDLSDFFAAFGRARGGGKAREDYPIPGQDYEIVASVSLEQIYRGGEIDVRAELPEYDQNGLAHRVARTFRITIPKGAADGQRLRLAGKGGPGFNGGRPGDLYVALALQPHPLYRIDGRDLYIDLPLTPWEAVLGAAVHIPTLGGTVELNVKPGTSAGQKLRLAKRGLPTTDGSVGALYAVIRIEVPTTPDATERELFQQLAATSKFNPRQYFASGANS
ncbi:MAG: DnaJ C-terminal domain-containing protein [Candidatus Dechloromonas phosphoritropha]